MARLRQTAMSRGERRVTSITETRRLALRRNPTVPIHNGWHRPEVNRALTRNLVCRTLVLPSVLANCVLLSPQCSLVVCSEASTDVFHSQLVVPSSVRGGCSYCPPLTLMFLLRSFRGLPLPFALFSPVSPPPYPHSCLHPPFLPFFFPSPTCTFALGSLPVTSSELLGLVLLQRHITRLIKNNEMIRHLVFQTYDATCELQMKLFVELFDNVLTSTFANPWVFLKGATTGYEYVDWNSLVCGLFFHSELHVELVTELCSA